MHYLLSNNLLSTHQFGFHPGNSIQEALLCATDDWHIHLDEGYSVAAVFYDLSKGFDIVPHSKLIYVLRDFCISGSLLKWFQSYLPGRQQRVVLNAC